jgi:hypothetical protein
MIEMLLVASKGDHFYFSYQRLLLIGTLLTHRIWWLLGLSVSVCPPSVSSYQMGFSGPVEVEGFFRRIPRYMKFKFLMVMGKDLTKWADHFFWTIRPVMVNVACKWNTE